MTRSKRQYGSGCLLKRGKGWAIRWREMEIARDGERRRAQRYVSMPVDWNDLDERPERWTLLNIPRRLASLRRDPWRQYWVSAQEISAASLAAVGRAVVRDGH